jgi:DNA polymerase III gamma/tau subunit
VYGLASAEKISELEKAIFEGDYDTILKITDEFSENGLDFYRALLDLSDQFRTSLVESLKPTEKTGNSESIARILDELREGETLVRSGLSEKANFEVTLFRAVEAGRTRSIDQVIRKITQILPAESKKKTNLKPSAIPVEKRSAESSFTPDTVKAVVPSDSLSLTEVENEETSETSSVDLFEEPVPIEYMVKEEIQLEPIESEKKKKNLQVTDPEKIKTRMEKLPPEVRELIDEKFRGEYFSIEKIDRNILI